MDTSPWNYWAPDGTPRPFTTDVLAALESVLARHPDHPGAIHLYIHAVEASDNPARAEQYAERLPALVPGAGHLVHMPGHIYLRTGRYHDASIANENAIKADEAYLANNPVPGNMLYEAGYYPHNFHFFVASASFEGRRADALRAADQVRAKTHPDMLRDPAFGGMMQHMHLTPLLTKMRFNLWDEVLAEPPAPDDLPYMRGMSAVARGLAHAAQGRLDEAGAELKQVEAVKEDPALTELYISSANVGQGVVAVGYEILAGEIAVRRKRADEAVAHFARAVELEDGLTYTEPPDWPIPARQMQGAAMLALGRWRDAETAFREDMRTFPDNGWSLSGLHRSLVQQGRAQEAAEVRARLDEAWQRADADLSSATTR
jgi:tetratricopeptide (TPR) repeat protein